MTARRDPRAPEVRTPALGATFFRITVWVGLTAAVTARALFGLVTRPVRSRARDAVALAIVGGAVIEACVFEPGLATYGNHVWSLAAALVLLAPEATASAAAWARQRAFPGARLVLSALLGVHLLAGLIYLVRYSWLRQREVRLSSREALDVVRKATRPDRRVLLDLTLIPTAACPHLGRQSPLPMVPLIQPDEGADLAEWLDINRGASPDPSALDNLLIGCGGVVIGPQTRQLRRPLRTRGWRVEETELPPKYRLFKPPPG
jgi:hypothetical protein